jgi:hypothetical protein
MDPRQIERAAYLAAHAVLAANTSAPELACPGARRSHAVDTIADAIKRVFEAHSDEMDELTDWWQRSLVTRRPHLTPALRPARSGEILQMTAETAAMAKR